MTFQQIQYVIEVANCGSISQAAETLFVAQPSISASIKALEEELHIQIFSRSRRGVEVTEDGKAFLSYARPLMHQQNKILEIYSQKELSPAYQITLSTQRYPFIIKSFMEYFQELDPARFEVRLREVGMYQVIDDVACNRSDIGFIYILSTTAAFIKRFLAMKDLEFNEITSIVPRVFFHKDHPMASRKEVSLEDMAVYPFASFDSDLSVSDNFAEEAYIQTFNANQNHFYVTDRATMMNVLSHTNAFSIGTGILSEGFAWPTLVSRPIASSGLDVHIGWLNKKGRGVTPALYDFISKVHEVLGEM